MATKKSPEQLAKLLAYILGRQPDEFGLVPDDDGFVKIQELIKAISEEDGWRHVRRSHIQEVLISIPNAPIEVVENRIRATDRSHLALPEYVSIPPKLLYTCVRRRAHATVMEKGIRPGAHPMVILSSDPDLATRIGRRSDQQPVMFTVQVQKALDVGVTFFQAGAQLFLSESIPVGCFSGPPLPKEKAESPAREPNKKPKKDRNKTPGSFFPDVAQQPNPNKPSASDKKKRDIAKSKAKKRMRREKAKKWWP